MQCNDVLNSVGLLEWSSPETRQVQGGDGEAL